MHRSTAEQLAALYEVSFGGKERGRFRIPMKLLRELMGRRRVYEDDVRKVSRHLMELGYVLIDMESYFAILSTRTFASYRRANVEALASITVAQHRDEMKTSKANASDAAV